MRAVGLKDAIIINFISNGPTNFVEQPLTVHK